MWWWFFHNLVSVYKQTEWELESLGHISLRNQGELCVCVYMCEWGNNSGHFQELLELLSLSLSLFFSFSCTTGCGILVPPPGTEPGPQQWKHRVLTTGLPGNSMEFIQLPNNHYLYCKAPLQKLECNDVKGKGCDFQWLSLGQREEYLLVVIPPGA